ncbi:MAG TPA: LuxR family transcriptional regulator [Actinomycetales bacterium]|nr:LuxR family transcriptional regulator [Actinomycetales bacterium]
MSSAVVDHAPADRSLRQRPALSPREVEVLRTWLLADTKEEAARSLYLAPTTVTTYITRVRSKYLAAGRPARSKSRLLAHALRDGWIRLEDFA